MEGEKLFSGQGGVAQLNGAALPELPDIYSRELREIVLSCLARESENRVSAERLKTVASKSVLRYQVFDTVGKHSDRDVRTLLRQMPKIGGSGVINNVCSGKNITVKNTFADGNMRILYGMTDDYGNVLVDFVYDYLEDFGVCYLPGPGPIIHGRFIGAFYKQGDCVGYLRIKENGDIEEFTRWTQKEFFRLSTLT